MTTTTATMTAAQLASLLSLHVYASTDKVTPVIGLIQIQRVGHTLEALVTDRYCLARGQYLLDPDTYDDDTDDPIYIEAATAKQYLPMVKKANRTVPVIVDHDSIRLEMVGITIPLATAHSKFPPVNNLIPDNLEEYTANPAGVVSLRPSYVAKLSKVILPGQGRSRRGSGEDPWRFHIGTHEGYNGKSKPAPVVCEPIAKDGGEVLVMIQPNMLTN